MNVITWAALALLPLAHASWADVPSSQAAPDAVHDGVFAGGQLVAGAAIESAATATTTTAAFVLDRVEAGAGMVADDTWSALVRLEGIRSATAQSAFGIDGNSLLPRFRLAYAAATPAFDVAGATGRLVLRAGLVPDAWVEGLESVDGTRGLFASPAERSGLWSTSDLGVELGARVAGLVDVRVQALNGEGRNDVELNLDKDVQALVFVTPASFVVWDGTLRVGGGGVVRHGSSGVSSLRADRAGLALFAAHPLAHLVLEGARGEGVADRASLVAWTGALRLDAQLWPGWLGLCARVEGDHLHDAQRLVAVRTRASVGVFSDLGRMLRSDDASSLRRLRIYVLAEGAQVDDGGAPIAGVAEGGARGSVRMMLDVTGLSTWDEP